MSEDTDALEPRRRSTRATALARAIREARGAMRQMDFAELAGRPQSVISYWETGASTPSLDALCALEEAVGLPLGTLAAQAGYFTLAGAAALPGAPIRSLVLEELDDAIDAVRAANAIGMGSRLTSSSAPGSTRSQNQAQWLVEILAPSGDEE